MEGKTIERTQETVKNENETGVEGRKVNNKSAPDTDDCVQGDTGRKVVISRQLNVLRRRTTAKSKGQRGVDEAEEHRKDGQEEEKIRKK